MNSAINPAPEAPRITPEQAPLPTTAEGLFETLQSLDIKYKLYHHEAVFTVAESEAVNTEIPGIHCRNLYLRDKKKKNFLIVAANETKVDIKDLQAKLECGRLSFGSSDRLFEYLGIRPGSVCPFTVVNDTEHQVQIVLDKAMMAGKIVNYHPLDNTMTVGITPDDLLKFLAHTGHPPLILDL